MLSAILLTIQVLVGIAMGGLILLQRSEGGALGMGGGPSGLVSARGAGNILTRATAILAVIFFVNCVGLTVVINLDRNTSSAINKVDARTIKQAAPAAGAAATSAAAPLTEQKRPSLSDLPVAATSQPTATTTPPATQNSSSSASQ